MFPSPIRELCSPSIPGVFLLLALSAACPLRCPFPRFRIRPFCHCPFLWQRSRAPLPSSLSFSLRTISPASPRTRPMFILASCATRKFRFYCPLLVLSVAPCACSALSPLPVCRGSVLLRLPLRSCSLLACLAFPPARRSLPCFSPPVASASGVSWLCGHRLPLRLAPFTLFRLPCEPLSVLTCFRYARVLRFPPPVPSLALPALHSAPHVCFVAAPLVARSSQLRTAFYPGPAFVLLRTHSLSVDSRVATSCCCNVLPPCLALFPPALCVPTRCTSSFLAPFVLSCF